MVRRVTGRAEGGGGIAAIARTNKPAALPFPVREAGRAMDAGNPVWYPPSTLCTTPGTLSRTPSALCSTLSTYPVPLGTLRRTPSNSWSRSRPRACPSGHCLGNWPPWGGTQYWELGGQRRPCTKPQVFWQMCLLGWVPTRGGGVTHPIWLGLQPLYAHQDTYYPTASKPPTTPTATRFLSDLNKAFQVLSTLPGMSREESKPFRGLTSPENPVPTYLLPAT